MKRHCSSRHFGATGNDRPFVTVAKVTALQWLGVVRFTSYNTPMPAALSRRRWFRISLRTMLILVTVLCISLGVKVNQARRQKEAIAALKSVKSAFVFYHQLRGGPS